VTTPTHSSNPPEVVTVAPPAAFRFGAFRTRLLDDPHVAWAVARQPSRRPRVSDLGRDLLSSMGRPGTTWGRKTGERHLIRVPPYLRVDGIRDIVVMAAEQLLLDGLLSLVDAGSAAPGRCWLLLGEAMRADVATWLPSVAQRWRFDEFEQYWEQRLRRAEGDDTRCPTALHPPWVEVDNAAAAVAMWAADPPACLRHSGPVECLKDAFRGAQARSELTHAQATSAALAYVRTLSPTERHVADVALGRDVYTPAVRALGSVGAGAHRLAISDVAADGSGLSAGSAKGSGVVVSNMVDQRAIAAQRTHSVMSGGASSSPLLTIFGEAP
jgi:hypothetical protein